MLHSNVRVVAAHLAQVYLLSGRVRQSIHVLKTIPLVILPLVHAILLGFD